MAHAMKREPSRRETAGPRPVSRPKDAVVVAGAPLSGAERWLEIFAPHLPADFYDIKHVAQGLGRADEPYIRDKAAQILTQLVEDNIRKGENLGIVSELYGDEWATGRIEELRKAGYRIRLLLIYCEESVMTMRARRRNLNADGLIERQRRIIEQATAQAAKGARVELLHSRKGPPLHTHTIQDGAILYQSKLTLRRDVVWNQYRNEVAQRILAGEPGTGSCRSGNTKPGS